MGDGWTKIDMHDLWREFCVAEAKAKSSGEQRQKQRWMFMEEESSEVNRFREHLKTMERMRFLNEGWKGLAEVNFEECVNVSVLKLNVQWFVEPSKINLDLTGLKYLKSLELKANKFVINCDGFGSLKHLVAVRWWADKATSPSIEAVGSLTKLQILELKGFDGDKLPNLSLLTALQVVCFAHCDNVVTITGLSSKLSSLRTLCISRCSNLRECPGLGDLHALEELDLWGCTKLEALPCLQRLTKLSHLNISECVLLREVPGLSTVALKELRAKGCNGLGRLLPMRNRTNLEVLRCTDLSEMESLDVGELFRLKECTFGWSRALKSVTCAHLLCDLTMIDLTLCLRLERLPDLSHFPSLEKLILQGCARLLSLSSKVPLPALRVLDLEGCRKLSALPEHLSSSVDLQVLRLQKTGIVMSGEDVRKLQASCERLEVFHSSAPSKYGDEYGVPSGSDVETNVQNQCRSRRLWDPLPREKV